MASNRVELAATLGPDQFEVGRGLVGDAADASLLCRRINPALEGAVNFTAKAGATANGKFPRHKSPDEPRRALRRAGRVL